MKLTDQTYSNLTQAGFDVLVDDREESPGRKFNDADLVGMPVRITVGKKSLSEGKIEIKIRKTNEVLMVPADELISKMKDILK